MTDACRRDVHGRGSGRQGSPTRRESLILAAGLAAFLAVLPIGPVWSAYTYPYLWGPVVSDAAGHEVDGIGPGYTPVSTFTYAALMIAGLILVLHLLRRSGIRIDRGFVLASLPFVALGPALRVLEDAGYYHRPLAYLFISPMVYVLIACLLLSLLAAADAISRLPRRARSAAVALVLVALGAFALAVGSGSRWTSPPLAALACAVLAVAFAAAPFRWGRSAILAYLGVSLMALSAIPLVRVAAAGPWDGGEHEVSAWVVPATVGIAAGITAMVFFAWKVAVGAGWTDAPPTAMPLFFAHLLDGAATAIGVEHFGAWEKHPLPRALIEASGTAFVMVPMKLIVVFLFVWLVRGPFRRDLEETPDLYHLVYLAVLVLGLAPGLRDMLRIALGV